MIVILAQYQKITRRLCWLHEDSERHLDSAGTGVGRALLASAGRRRPRFSRCLSLLLSARALAGWSSSRWKPLSAL